jgi:hypothetical protein
MYKTFITVPEYYHKSIVKTYKLYHKIMVQRAISLEEKQFKSVSLRRALTKQIQEFIGQHPTFVVENPEYNSVAGFIDKATRLRLQQLEKSVCTT